MVLALQLGGFDEGIGAVEIGVADVGRQRDAQGLEQLAGNTGHWGAQDEMLAILRDLDLLETIQVAPHVVPFGLEAPARVCGRW